MSKLSLIFSRNGAILEALFEKVGLIEIILDAEIHNFVHLLVLPVIEACCDSGDVTDLGRVFEQIHLLLIVDVLLWFTNAGEFTDPR